MSSCVCDSAAHPEVTWSRHGPSHTHTWKRLGKQQAPRPFLCSVHTQGSHQGMQFSQTLCTTSVCRCATAALPG